MPLRLGLIRARGRADAARGQSRTRLQHLRSFNRLSPPKGDHLCSNARQPFQPSPSLPPFGLLPLLPGWPLRQMLRRFALIPHRKKKKGGGICAAPALAEPSLLCPSSSFPPKKKAPFAFSISSSFGRARFWQPQIRGQHLRAVQRDREAPTLTGDPSSLGWPRGQPHLGELRQIPWG